MRIKQALQSPIKTNQIAETNVVELSKNEIVRCIDFIAADALAVDHQIKVNAVNRNEIKGLYLTAVVTIQSKDEDEFHLFEKSLSSTKIDDDKLKSYVSKAGCLTKDEYDEIISHCLQKYSEYSK